MHFALVFKTYLFLLFGVPASLQSGKSIFQISYNLRRRSRTTEQRHLLELNCPKRRFSNLQKYHYLIIFKNTQRMIVGGDWMGIMSTLSMLPRVNMFERATIKDWPNCYHCKLSPYYEEMPKIDYIERWLNTKRIYAFLLKQGEDFICPYSIPTWLEFSQISLCNLHDKSSFPMVPFDCVW